MHSHRCWLLSLLGTHFARTTLNQLHHFSVTYTEINKNLNQKEAT